VELHHIGGHTVGSSITYFPAEKVLFSGDLFFTGGVNFNIPFLNFYQNKCYDKIAKRTGNPEECINALEKFKTMDIEVIVSGHGSIVKNPYELIHTQLTFYKSLRSHIIEILDNNKSMIELDLRKFRLIKDAYDRIENSIENKKKHTIWLENYLDKLKKSYYNYYMYNHGTFLQDSSQNENQ
jgi:glyoxylase-like metal-dependent hydrolase (beta-lactamase superfamily II)